MSALLCLFKWSGCLQLWHSLIAGWYEPKVYGCSIFGFKFALSNMIHSWMSGWTKNNLLSPAMPFRSVSGAWACGGSGVSVGDGWVTSRGASVKCSCQVQWVKLLIYIDTVCVMPIDECWSPNPKLCRDQINQVLYCFTIFMNQVEVTGSNAFEWFVSFQQPFQTEKYFYFSDPPETQGSPDPRVAIFACQC